MQSASSVGSERQEMTHMIEQAIVIWVLLVWLLRNFTIIRMINLSALLG